MKYRPIDYYHYWKDDIISFVSFTGANLEIVLLNYRISLFQCLVIYPSHEQVHQVLRRY